MLHVKRPTAKIIIKRYQAVGTFFQKKMPQGHGQPPHASFASQHTLPELPTPSQQIALQEKSIPEVVQAAQESACQEEAPLPSCLCPQLTYVVLYPPFLHFQCYLWYFTKNNKPVNPSFPRPIRPTPPSLPSSLLPCTASTRLLAGHAICGYMMGGSTAAQRRVKLKWWGEGYFWRGWHLWGRLSNRPLPIEFSPRHDYNSIIMQLVAPYSFQRMGAPWYAVW